MRAPWRSVFLLVILAPLLVSVVVRAFGWSLVLGPAGFVNQFFEWVGIGRVRMLYTPIAVVVALVHVMLPFMVIPVWTSLQKLDPHGRERRAVAGRVALHGAAPRGAAAGHAGPAVGRADRVRAQRQRAGHPRAAGRAAR
jgi:ABC-type molybdate transport system permease subunit